MLHTNGKVGKNVVQGMNKLSEIMKNADKNDIQMCIENL